MSRRGLRGDVYTILTVCTGNICRSPLAEEMFRRSLGNDSQFEISSAGLHAVVGSPMDPDAAQQLRSHGGDPSGLHGEQITREHAASADLILTMTRGQRDELIRRYPFAMQRTFTMSEFAMLAENQSMVGNSPKEVILQSARGRAQVRLSAADDVPDPIDASAKVHQSVGNQIVDLVLRIVRSLAD